MQHLLIAGGTGLVGTKLRELAIQNGYHVSVLTRNKSLTKASNYIYWNPQDQLIDKQKLTQVDYLVNLSGENIVKKHWTEKRKNELITSRVDTTKFLAHTFASISHTLKAVVNSSAIGFYNSSLNRVMKEDEAHGKGFMAELCSNWEIAAHAFENQNIRTIILRIGLVLANNGGAYAAMAKPAKLGLGSYIGSGKQKMPWVHIDDLCNLILYALENEKMSGVYNTTLPNVPTNKFFTKELLKSFHKFYLLMPTPVFFLKLFMGSRSLLLTSSYNPSAEKLLKTGFKFKYNSLSDAFKSLK